MQNPIVQAPMAGGGDTPQLVAAVSNAGGLGCFGAAYSTDEQIGDYAQRVRALTTRPFGVNLFVPPPQTPAATERILTRAIDRLAPFYAELGLEAPRPTAPSASSFEAQLEACLDTGARLLSFTFGALSGTAIARAKSRGMVVAGTATTVAEALYLEHCGVDAVITQGAEAGGHRGTFLSEMASSLIGTMALVPQVRDAVALPVIASGGIMDGRGVGAALLLGASAVQMGTAFLACDEAGVPDCYKDALVNATEDDLVLTRAFSGRYARGIGNRFTQAMQECDEVLPFPLQNGLTRPIRSAAADRGDASLLSLWAGQGVRMAKRRSTADLMRALVEDRRAALQTLRPARRSSAIP